MDQTDNDWNEVASRLDETVARLQSESDACHALCSAIEHHCRGQYVPEEVARWCRTHAVNLNRKLARDKGEPLPPLDGYMKDFMSELNTQ